MVWKKERIQLDNGLFADAQAPEIVSASRSTDIPAFYADWFFARLKKGYSLCLWDETRAYRYAPLNFPVHTLFARYRLKSHSEGRMAFR